MDSLNVPTFSSIGGGDNGNGRNDDSGNRGNRDNSGGGDSSGDGDNSGYSNVDGNHNGNDKIRNNNGVGTVVLESHNRTLKRPYLRHSSQQTARLEEAFRFCKHPDERAQHQLSLELGLQPKQIKFWFQNRRAKEKQKGSGSGGLDEERVPLDLNHQHFNGGLMFSGPEAAMNYATDLEKAMMKKAANDAFIELTRLTIHEHFSCSSKLNAKFILQREKYDKLFRRAKHLKGPRVRREISMDSRVVAINGSQLVDKLLDSEKWTALFPTILKRAYTLDVLDNGLPYTRSGALQLMYAEMHTLSPMVPSREFFFLRHCVQVNEGVWYMADVSFDHSKFDTTNAAWKLPSGCLIYDFKNGTSRVTWVEQVEVKDKFYKQKIFQNLVCDGYVYGAEKWCITLERIVERNIYASMVDIPNCDDGGVIILAQGRRNMMQLSERMVRLFCEALSGQVARDDYCGVRFSTRKCSARLGEPEGIVVSAATSFWVPRSPQFVFQFLNNTSTRHQWDVLCHQNPVIQVERISNGSHQDNCTTIIRPTILTDENMLLLQESSVDPLACMMVYAPVDVASLASVMSGDDASVVPILPTGITIARNSNGPNQAPSTSSSAAAASPDYGSGGSIVTVMIQVLGSSPNSSPDLPLSFESLTTVNILAISTVQNIKLVLGCSAA